MNILLALLLLLLPSVAWAQAGFIQAVPGTSRPTCNSITSPVTNSTWCADASGAPGAYTWKIWNGTTYVPIATGGAGNPAPPNTSVQFNMGGVFGGDANLEWDNATKTLLTPWSSANPRFLTIESASPCLGDCTGYNAQMRFILNNTANPRKTAIYIEDFDFTGGGNRVNPAIAVFHAAQTDNGHDVSGITSTEYLDGNAGTFNRFCGGGATRGGLVPGGGVPGCTINRAAGFALEVSSGATNGTNIVSFTDSDPTNAAILYAALVPPGPGGSIWPEGYRANLITDLTNPDKRVAFRARFAGLEQTSGFPDTPDAFDRFLVPFDGSALLRGPGQATTTFNTSGVMGGVLQLQDTGVATNAGGAVLFGAGPVSKFFAAVKGVVGSDNNNTSGNLSFQTRTVDTDGTLSQAMLVSSVFPQVSVFSSDSNGAAIKLVGNGGTTPSKILRATAGRFEINDDAFTRPLLSVFDNGDVVVAQTDLATYNNAFVLTPGNVATAGITSDWNLSSGATGTLHFLPDTAFEQLDISTTTAAGEHGRLKWGNSAGILLEYTGLSGTANLTLGAGNDSLGTDAPFTITNATPLTFGTSTNAGSTMRLAVVHEDLTIAAAAFTDTSVQAPAGSTVAGVGTRVITTIPGPAVTYDVGVAGATTRYATAVSVAATSTSASTGTTNPSIPATATSIRITPNANPGAATGVVRIYVWYWTASAPAP